MRRSGTADLPLHYGTVPPWLAERMAKLGGAVTESIILHYGKSEFLTRISDPFWFQALGAVMGMDWHSSGITTSVLGALKKSLNPKSSELGIFICGGRGKHSRNTPAELIRISDKTGMDGKELVKASKLTAKVDNTAIQDGFQLYLHSFIVTNEGEWAVVQQGMNDSTGMARRYHWHSTTVKSFIEEPHSFIYGKNVGEIINLTAKDSAETKKGILEIAKEKPDLILPEIKKIILPRHHEVKKENVNLKRLGAVLALAQELPSDQFEDFLLLEGLGPRTLQSLVLVSEVIHGTPSRFTDPARFSFAHGGKDGHPFPVPVKTYDETLAVLSDSIEKSKLGFKEKSEAIKSLSDVAQNLEKNFEPDPESFEKLLEKERKDSWKYGGRTVFGKSIPPKDGTQLKLF